MVEVLFVIVIALLLYVVYDKIKQQKINKKIQNYERLINAVSKESRTGTELSVSLSQEVIRLNEQSTKTRQIYLNLADSSEQISKAIELLAKNQKNTNINLGRLATAFKKKSESDQKFVDEIYKNIDREEQVEKIEEAEFFWPSVKKKDIN